MLFPPYCKKCKCVPNLSFLSKIRMLPKHTCTLYNDLAVMKKYVKMQKTVWIKWSKSFDPLKESRIKRIISFFIAKCHLIPFLPNRKLWQGRLISMDLKFLKIIFRTRCQIVCKNNDQCTFFLCLERIHIKYILEG